MRAGHDASAYGTGSRSSGSFIRSELREWSTGHQC